jgi:hypothetical protein
MKYLEWNNIIASYFFNSANAGKEIYLYLNKKNIIALGKASFAEETDEEIWLDYITSIKIGLPGSVGNIISKAKFAHSKNNLVGLKKHDGNYATIDNVAVLYPPFVSYLLFIVLPLIEDYDNSNNMRSNNYYGRLNSFLQNNHINTKLNTEDFRDNEINCLWEDLAYWANIKNNGDLGLFKVNPFSNANWIYVGKVFSQCVLPPKFVNQLSKLFASIGLVPDTLYDDNFLREKIINSKHDLIPKNTLNFLKTDDELSHSIIQTIQQQYKKWCGESHEEIEDGTTLKKKRNFTIAPLFLQFKVNTNEESIAFSYRIYSTNDYPDDLKFDEYENLYEINGWSKTIPLDFRECIEVKDNFNKWIAKFPNRDVRLFISAATFQLSSDYWIETNVLSKTERMYLLCKDNKHEQIKHWGKTFENGNFKQADYDGIPDNYSLFWLHKPTVGISDIPILTLHTEKRVELVGGLKINFRTYSNEFLPEVEITNSDGKENLYLQHKDSDEKIPLAKKTSFNNRWLLPDNTAINSDFYIKIEDEIFPSNSLAYNLVSAHHSAIKVDGTKLPKRDSFGRHITQESEQFCLGSNIVNPNKSSQRYFSTYGSLFTSTIQETQPNIKTATFINDIGNKLANFLSLKNELTTEQFFKAFEFFYSVEFPKHEENTDYNLTKLKRASLNFYDYIGILDYDYETKKIVLNPPQFIFVPQEKGRMVLLIGARDTALIANIITTAPKYNLQVELKKQFTSNARLLLPDVVTVKAFEQADDPYGENSIKAFAAQLKIKFTTDYFPPVAMQDFSATIVEYENTLQETKESDYDWARYIFNPETLNFDKNKTSIFDKNFSLVRYKLNEYTYEYKLWKNNKCYKVDMNWGKFIALKHFQKEVILFDNTSNKVAIPISTSLPRLLSEAIMLLSGKAPDFREIDNIKYRVYENVAGIFTQNLFRLKLGQNAINKKL